MLLDCPGGISILAAHGFVTWCLAGLSLPRKVQLTPNTLLAATGVLVAGALLVVSPWLVPEFIIWVPTGCIWALGNLLMPIAGISKDALIVR